MRDDTVDQFIAHELTRGDLQALMARSDGPGLVRAAWHLGALAVTGTLLWTLRSTVWVVPLIVAHGYALAFLFCAFHETAHRTAFRTRWLNAALGTLAGFLTFWPYRNYRVFHWEHHRHTQDPARDPEPYFAKPSTLPAYLFVLTGIPNLRRRLTDLVMLGLGRADKPWMAVVGVPPRASTVSPGLTVDTAGLGQPEARSYVDDVVPCAWAGGDGWLTTGAVANASWRVG